MQDGCLNCGGYKVTQARLRKVERWVDPRTGDPLRPQPTLSFAGEQATFLGVEVGAIVAIIVMFAVRNFWVGAMVGVIAFMPITGISYGHRQEKARTEYRARTDYEIRPLNGMRFGCSLCGYGWDWFGAGNPPPQPGEAPTAG